MVMIVVSVVVATAVIQGTITVQEEVEVASLGETIKVAALDTRVVKALGTATKAVIKTEILQVAISQTTEGLTIEKATTIGTDKIT